ncbi:MAG: carboxypeptidase regulatory-like domain-containing protein, partial [Nocardioidaceae bacterium]
MPQHRQLRTFTSLVVAPLTFLSMALISAGPAQAVSAVSAVPSATASHGKTVHVTKGDKKAANKAQKAAEAHYKPAACNTLQSTKSKVPLARCFAVGKATSAGQLIVRADGPPSTALGPADIQSAYNLPASGTGETVAVVDAFGYNAAESDLGVFRSYYGLPPCTTANGCFTKVDQNGGTNYPPEDAGWSIETALDLDAISSACPNCKILLVEGNDNSLDNLGIAVNTAASLGAVAISNSYGVPGESPDETTYDHYYNHQGIAVTASTGDTGDVTNWPATNPNVVGVGGTTLTKDTTVPRGWSESAWADGGSGCSLYEAKPAYQANIVTDCGNRAIADISADADPATGLGIYNTLGAGGWAQYGGTSLSSPLIASMYALAGTPVPGTYPVTYPYGGSPSALNDVTTGSNGGCGNVLCNAGPGWDGPTGLGTPNGVNALTTGPHGDIAGEVTDSSDGDPIAGATVSTPGGYSATTDSSGDYDLTVPVGSYDVTAAAFGYNPLTQSGVNVTEGQTTTENFALTAVPSHVVSGTVEDGSGQSWPLYAKITVSGLSSAIYTNPYTGHYSVTLPQGSYTLHVESQYPGYTPADQAITVGSTNVHQNVDVLVDQSTCNAPGYGYTYNGTGTQFTGWTDKTAQDGWTNVDNIGNGMDWEFDNPGNRTPPPGGDSDFAILDSDHYGIGNSQDASLVSPVVDMSSQTTPEIGFDTYYDEYFNSVADVDLSTDGGATWTNVWEQTTNSVQGHVDIPIPQAAGKPDVQVRFHYTGNWAFYWELDNVFIGNRSCDPQGGGLVAGIVKDNNTKAPIDGAKVASVPNPSDFGISAATPDDANLSDGFYWLYSSQSGTTQFTATDGKYTPATANVNVAGGFMTQKNWSLKAGHLTVSTTSISKSMRMGASKSATITYGNEGTSPVQVTLGEQDGGFTPMAGLQTKVSKTGTVVGAPVRHVKGTFSTHAMVLNAKKGASSAKKAMALRTANPYAPPWTDIADYPTPTMDNEVGFNAGLVYSVAGFNGTANVANGYVYDPSSQAWSAIANAPAALESPVGGFVNGKMYVVGGWDASGNASSGNYVYDPSSNSWSQAAALPESISAAGSAVLNGQLYIIGGCTSGFCSPTSSKVYSYDPSSDSWTQHADFPSPAAFTMCAGIAGEIVCAGGTNADTGASSNATYAYDPGSDSWTQVANLPIDLWAGAASGSGGKLQVAGGVTANGGVVTNQAFEYDPSANSWTALANSNNSEYRGGGSCGMYKVGGSTGGFSPAVFSEVLPGYDQCGGAADVPWLSESQTAFTVAPGQTVNVIVTLDSSMVSQPGDYLAKLTTSTDSPYSVAPVNVAMHVIPPRSWGKIRGTVTDAVSGNPIPGVTVQICTMFDRVSGNCGPVTYTLKTDANGYYQLWLNKGYNPLE